jgi:hypothetical protein
MLIFVVECHCVVHHCVTGYWGENVVRFLVGPWVGFKTPAAGHSRESLPNGTQGEAGGGRVVEGQGWGMGFCWTSAHGTWEEGLVHIAHVTAHCVVACCCTLVVFTLASTCHAAVVVVNIAAMCKTVVPVLIPFNRQGGEATWGLNSSVAAAVTATIAATVAAATAAVATADCNAAATTATATAAATTTNVIATTTAIVTTIATAVVATALLAMAASIPGVLWLLLWGLALAVHLKLAMNCQDVGGI